MHATRVGVLGFALLWIAAAGRPARASDDLATGARELWFYCSTNLLVDANVDRLERLFERAGKAGYSKVLLADTKFARLGTLDARYFINARRAVEAARRAKLVIVPAVFPIGCSEGILFHDPDLAEALPVKEARFVVAQGRAQAVADPHTLTQPEWKDDLFVPDWNDAPEWNDGTEGKDGVGGKGWRCKDPAGRNARLVFRLKLAPFHAWHVALTVETREFEGEPRVQVLVGGKGLLFSNLGVQKSQPPTRHHLLFNSLDLGESASGAPRADLDPRLYVGAWGAGGGELAVSDIVIEEAGLVNLVRREGAPFVERDGAPFPERDGAPFIVRRVDGKPCVEGRDFEFVTDPKAGHLQWPGSFDAWHEPPSFATKLPDGTQLEVSWHHAVTVNDGQVMVCPCEPRTLELLRDEARRVGELFGSHQWFMSHDEIRVLNQDESCRRRKQDAGKLLADHVKACAGIVRAVDPKAELHVWSDMFDPHHNAHADYYLVRGDLAGAWEGLDPAIVVANWNFDRRAESLAFFAGRGHRQVVAAYYDAPLEQVQAWLESAKAVKGVVGFIYTTWAARYDDLEAFAELVRAGG